MRFWLSMLPVLVIDQLSKWYIVSNYQLGESSPWLGNWLFLTYVQNRGAAFGMLEGHSWFFLVSALVVVIALIIYNARYPVDKYLQFLMGFIVAGAIGNFIDRYRFGYVVDFFDLRWWPVFNVADIAIVVGGFFLVIYMFFYMKEG